MAGQPSIAISAVVRLLSWLFGGATVSWLVPWITLFLAVVLAARITPGGTVAKCVAGTFYCVNPFVFERLYAGQIFVLLGYALLPVVAASIVGASTRRGWQQWTPAVWITLDGAISVHFIWIDLVLLVGIVIWQRTRRTLLWSAAVVGLTAALNAYLVLPYLLQRPTVVVGNTDLAAFRTAADPVFGLYINVLGLYGFWRQGPTLPKAVVVAWPAILAIFLLVAGLAWWRSAIRANNTLIGALGVAAVLGFFLSLGNQGPTGSIFSLFYAHIPGFALMREPEKFSSLLALAYAVCGGIGVELMSQRYSAMRASAWGILGVLAVVAYTPTIFWGLSGQLASGRYPADWQVANQIMGTGTGSILSLPLNEYESFSFTQKRVVANPAPVAFSRPVLVGGVVDAGPLVTQSVSPENAFLSDVVAHGNTIHHLGRDLAQLGIRYVVLFKTANFRSYNWLAHQRDLVEVFHSPDIAVYRNPLALAQGARLNTSITVPSLACFFNLQEHEDLRGQAAIVRRASACPTPTNNLSSPVTDVKATSPTSYHAAPGPSGYVIVPQPADGTWTSKGLRAVTLANGIQAISASNEPVTISYRRSWVCPAGDLISVILCTAVFLFTSRRAGQPRLIQAMTTSLPEAREGPDAARRGRVLLRDGRSDS